MNKITTIIISLCLSIANINCCFALNNNTSSNIEEYAETGQYDFSNCTITQQNNDIFINYNISDTNMIIKSSTNNDLSILNENKELKEVINDTINSFPNCDIKSIGYTTIYIRKIIDNKTGNILSIIPLTKE